MKYAKVVVVLIVVTVSLFVLNDFNLTGDVVWNPIPNNNCSDTQIETIWESISVEFGSDILILKENEVGGSCEKYLAYKNNSEGELWVLSGENYNLTSWGGDFLYSNGGRILNKFNLSFAYFNTTSSFIETFNDTVGIDSKITFLEEITIEDLTNWSVSDISSLEGKVAELYSFDSILGENFSDDGIRFIFSELTANDVNYSNFDVIVYKNESFSQVIYSIITYDPNFVIDFMSNIPDYTFNISSSWNFAFDLSDYFNVSDDVLIEFDFTGINNTNGELINYSIDEGSVFFMPAVNFNDSFEFNFVANNPAGNNVYSNNFSVNIIIPNNAPTLIKNFENINMSYNDNVTINLNDYFEDADNDSLNYVASKFGGVNFSINNSVLNFWLNSDFNIYAKLLINANDGVDSTAGNWFYLYKNVSYEILENVNTSHNVSLTEEENEPIENNGIDDKSVSKDDTNWVKWFVWGIMVVVVLGVIMFMIWFFILKKNDEPIVPSSSPGVSVSPKHGPPHTPVNSIPRRVIPKRQVAPVRPTR